jgi:hypothetical protein
MSLCGAYPALALTPCVTDVPLGLPRQNGQDQEPDVRSFADVEPTEPGHVRGGHFYGRRARVWLGCLRFAARGVLCPCGRFPMGGNPDD